mgnify:CR=1 FL=1
MKKQLFCAGLCLALTLSMGTQAFAEEVDSQTAPGAEEAAQATVTTAEVVINGETMTNFRAELYGGTSYVSLYGATLALRPDAVIAWEDNQMVERAEDFELSARVGTCYLVVNGRYLYIPDGVKFDAAGDTLVPVRVLAQALGATVEWDGRVLLTGGGTPLESGDTYYNAEELDLIARVIMHESGNQPLEGKIAVGNVILNRVEHPSFPDTVYDVLFQKNQFPGATNATPNEESILAAKLCLDGASVVPDAYWFSAVGLECWASINKDLVTVIGGHAFYG